MHYKSQFKISFLYIIRYFFCSCLSAECDRYNKIINTFKHSFFHLRENMLWMWWLFSYQFWLWMIYIFKSWQKRELIVSEILITICLWNYRMHIACNLNLYRRGMSSVINALIVPCWFQKVAISIVQIIMEGSHFFYSDDLWRRHFLYSVDLGRRHLSYILQFHKVNFQ